MNDEIIQLMAAAERLVTTNVSELKAAKVRSEDNLRCLETLQCYGAFMDVKIQRMKLRIELLDHAIKSKEASDE